MYWESAFAISLFALNDFVLSARPLFLPPFRFQCEGNLALCLSRMEKPEVFPPFDPWCGRSLTDGGISPSPFVVEM